MGKVDVTVTTTGGTSVVAGAANDFSYTVVTPVVSSIDVVSGSTVGGTSVTITGTGFVSTSTVKFGELSGTNVSVVSPTSITVKSPATVTPGSVHVTVSNGVLTSSTSSADLFEFTTVAPVVSSISPVSGSTVGGTVVTITGTGFIDGASVKFGGLVGTSVSVVSPTSITVTSPATVTPGSVDVVVRTSFGPSATDGNGDNFLYEAPKPVVSGLSATSGPVTGGTAVVITGTGFITGASVAFGNVVIPSTSVTVTDATHLSVTAPASVVVGTVDVTVATTGGTSLTTDSGNDFEYTVVTPEVDSLSLGTGSTVGGDEVVISGRGFVEDSTVSFGGLDADVVDVTPTEITVTSPATVAVGAVDVTVSNGELVSATSVDDLFDYTPELPVVSRITPAKGSTVGGTSVTITGSGFITGSTVKFGTLTGLVERIDFRMRLARGHVPAFAHDGAVANQHAAHTRIG